MVLVALELSTASFLTSLATTPKPLPYSPARAASIEAFNPKRFVYSAIFRMKFEMFFVSSVPAFTLLAATVDFSWAVARSCA